MEIILIPILLNFHNPHKKINATQTKLIEDACQYNNDYANTTSFTFTTLSAINAEFTMSNNKKITAGDIITISGAYKLSTKEPSNNGYTKGVKICD